MKAQYKLVTYVIIVCMIYSNCVSAFPYKSNICDKSKLSNSSEFLCPKFRNLVKPLVASANLLDKSIPTVSELKQLRFVFSELLGIKDTSSIKIIYNKEVEECFVYYESKILHIYKENVKTEISGQCAGSEQVGNINIVLYNGTQEILNSIDAIEDPIILSGESIEGLNKSQLKGIAERIKNILKGGDKGKLGLITDVLEEILAQPLPDTSIVQISDGSAMKYIMNEHGELDITAEEELAGLADNADISYERTFLYDNGIKGSRGRKFKKRYKVIKCGNKENQMIFGVFYRNSLYAPVYNLPGRDSKGDFLYVFINSNGNMQQGKEDILVKHAVLENYIEDMISKEDGLLDILNNKFQDFSLKRAVSILSWAVIIYEGKFQKYDEMPAIVQQLRNISEVKQLVRLFTEDRNRHNHLIGELVPEIFGYERDDILNRITFFQLSIQDYVRYGLRKIIERLLKNGDLDILLQMQTNSLEQDFLYVKKDEAGNNIEDLLKMEALSFFYEYLFNTLLEEGQYEKAKEILEKEIKLSTKIWEERKILYGSCPNSGWHINNLYKLREIINCVCAYDENGGSLDILKMMLNNLKADGKSYYCRRPRIRLLKPVSVLTRKYFSLHVGKAYQWNGGRYKITEELEGGGMGMIYRAKVLEGSNRGKSVIIKCSKLGHEKVIQHERILHKEVWDRLHKLQPGDGDAIDLDEGSRRCIPEYYFGGRIEKNGLEVLVMEDIEGDGWQDLSVFRRKMWENIRKSTSLQDKVRKILMLKKIFEDLLKKLQWLHAVGALHKDLKPSNIMIKYNEKTGELQTKLFDLGISELIGNDETSQKDDHLRGTPGFFAPKYILRKKSTESTEVYALGVIMYIMMSGENSPFGFMSSNSGVRVANGKSVHFNNLLSLYYNIVKAQHPIPITSLVNTLFKDLTADLEEYPVQFDDSFNSQYGPETIIGIIKKCCAKDIVLTEQEKSSIPPELKDDFSRVEGSLSQAGIKNTAEARGLFNKLCYPYKQAGKKYNIYEYVKRDSNRGVDVYKAYVRNDSTDEAEAGFNKIVITIPFSDDSYSLNTVPFRDTARSFGVVSGRSKELARSDEYVNVFIKRLFLTLKDAVAKKTISWDDFESALSSKGNMENYLKQLRKYFFEDGKIDDLELRILVSNIEVVSLVVDTITDINSTMDGRIKQQMIVFASTWLSYKEIAEMKKIDGASGCLLFMIDKLDPDRIDMRHEETLLVGSSV